MSSHLAAFRVGEEAGALAGVARGVSRLLPRPPQVSASWRGASVISPTPRSLRASSQVAQIFPGLQDRPRAPRVNQTLPSSQVCDGPRSAWKEALGFGLDWDRGGEELSCLRTDPRATAALAPSPVQLQCMLKSRLFSGRISLVALSRCQQPSAALPLPSLSLPPIASPHSSPEFLVPSCSNSTSCVPGAVFPELGVQPVCVLQ